MSSPKLLTAEGEALVRRMISQERAWRDTEFNLPGYSKLAPPWYPKPTPFSAGIVEALEWFLEQHQQAGSR